MSDSLQSENVTRDINDKICTNQIQIFTLTFGYQVHACLHACIFSITVAYTFTNKVDGHIQRNNLLRAYTCKIIVGLQAECLTHLPIYTYM